MIDSKKELEIATRSLSTVIEKMEQSSKNMDEAVAAINDRIAYYDEVAKVSDHAREIQVIGSVNDSLSADIVVMTKLKRELELLKNRNMANLATLKEVSLDTQDMFQKILGNIRNAPKAGSGPDDDGFN